MKTCTLCNNTLPLSNFGPRRGVVGGNSRCKKCCANYARKYYRNNPTKAQQHNRYMRAKRFGITIEEVIKFEDTDCQICGDRATVIDHCHKSGQIRGALCNSCNRGLGFFKDRVEFLKNAIEYLTIEQTE